jgi:hypothetical protein
MVDIWRFEPAHGAFVAAAAVARPAATAGLHAACPAGTALQVAPATPVRRAAVSVPVGNR